MKPSAPQHTAELAVTAPSFLWLLLFFAIPTVIVFLFAFHAKTPEGGVGPWSLQTWRELGDPDYPVIILKTLWVSLKVTVLCILLALPCAYAMARMNKKWQAFFAGAIMLPFWTGFVVRVFAWKTMLHPDGCIQTCYHAFLHFKYWLLSWAMSAPAYVDNPGGCLIGAAHCPVDNALTTILDSQAAVVLVSVYTFLPFAIMPIYTAAEKFDFSLLEAARDLGARSFYAFRKVFLPGIRQGIVSAILMVFIPAIGSYVIPQMVGGTSCVLIGNKIFERAMNNRNIPHASALSVLMAVSVLVPMAFALFIRARQKARDRQQAPKDPAQVVTGAGKAIAS